MKKYLVLLSTSLFLPTLAIADGLPLPSHDTPPPAHNIFIHPKLIASKVELNNTADLQTIASLYGATAIKLSDNAYLTSAPGFELLKDNVKEISLSSIDAPVEGGSALINLPAYRKIDNNKNDEPPKPISGPNEGGIYIIAKKAGPLGSLVDVAITKPENINASGVSYAFAEPVLETNLAKGLTLLIKDPSNPNVFYTLSFDDHHMHPPHLEHEHNHDNIHFDPKPE